MKRNRLAFAVLVGILVAACAKVTPPRAPTPAEPVVVALAPTLQVRPDPESFQIQPQLAVRTAKSVRLYTGRGSFYLPIADLAS